MLYGLVTMIGIQKFLIITLMKMKNGMMLLMISLIPLINISMTLVITSIVWLFKMRSFTLMYRRMIALIRLFTIVSTLYMRFIIVFLVHPNNSIQPTPIKYDHLQPYFGWLPLNIVQKTFEVTTQYACMPMSTVPKK
jgi:hypothetical protein